MKTKHHHHRIQLSYENPAHALPPETEQLIRTRLLTLLTKTGNEERSISLFFCEPTTIQSLNRTYRKIDKPTDILSWSYEGDDTLSDGGPWGELVVCLDICRKQADAANWPLETELLRLLVHGLGHLMGYDHEASEEEEKKMLEVEKQMLSSINLEGLYD